VRERERKLGTEEEGKGQDCSASRGSVAGLARAEVNDHIRDCSTRADGLLIEGRTGRLVADGGQRAPMVLPNESSASKRPLMGNWNCKTNTLD